MALPLELANLKYKQASICGLQLHLQQDIIQFLPYYIYSLGFTNNPANLLVHIAYAVMEFKVFYDLE